MRNRTVRIRTGLLAALGMIGAIALSTQGSVMYLPNPSFESQPTQFADPRIDDWAKAPQPPGFDTNVFGAWENLAGVFANAPSTNADHIVNAEGNQLAYLFGYPQAGISQDFTSIDWAGGAPAHAFNATFKPGKSYRLAVALTSSREEPLTPGSTLQLSLYYRDASSNIVPVAETTITYDTNVFTDISRLIDFKATTPTVKTNDSWAGKTIGVQIQSTVQPQLIGGVWDLDNVRLTEWIGVPNASFESQPTQFVDPRVDFWQKAPQPPTFDTNVFGSWDNLVGLFVNSPATNADHITNAEGNQLLYLFSYPQAGLLEDFNSTDWSNAAPAHAFNARFEPGKAYRLTAGVTSSREEPLTPGSTLQLSLYYRDASNNIVTLGATNITYDTNVFAEITRLRDFSVELPVVQPSDPWAGKNMGIQIQSTAAPQFIGGVWDVDNIRLDEIAPPRLTEPLRTGTQTEFALVSEPGLRFEILATTNIVDPAGNWTNLGTVTNSTGSVLFTDTTGPVGQRFYRARQVP